MCVEAVHVLLMAFHFDGDESLESRQWEEMLER